MDKYIGFDVDGKQTQGGNRQTRNRQNGFHLSPLPKFLDHSHQPIRGAQHHTRNARKMAPFSSVGDYNRTSVGAARQVLNFAMVRAFLLSYLMSSACYHLGGIFCTVQHCLGKQCGGWIHLFAVIGHAGLNTSTRIPG